MRQAVALFLALCVLAVALGMACASAWQRAAGPVDRALLVALSCAVVAAVHLLPALCRSGWLVWPLWALCFAVAVFGHAGFFVNANLQVAQIREAASSQAQALRERHDAITSALEGIKARPVAVVAGQLARTVTPERRHALELELTEAHRAAALRDQLVTLAAQRHDRAVTEGVTDPVTLSVARVLGVSANAVGLVLNLLMAALVELLGTVLWLQVMRPASRDPLQSPSQVVPVTGPAASVMALDPQTLPQAPADDPLARLRAAIENNEARPTVSSIREFMGCSQARASELRRALVG